GRWGDKAHEPRGAIIEDDVVIGGGCTIMPGVRIGARSFIAAGTLVTKDIPSGTLAKGRPARVEALPAALDRQNDRSLTVQPLDLWHPCFPDLQAWDFPPEWPPEARG